MSIYTSDIAAIAYEAYRRSVVAERPDLPPFEELHDYERDGWLSAALAVEDYLDARPREGKK